MGFNYKSIDINLPDVKKFLGEASSNTDFDNGSKSMNVESLDMNNTVSSNTGDYQVADTGVSCYIKFDHAPNVVNMGDFDAIEGNYEYLADSIGGQLDDHNSGDPITKDYTMDYAACDDYVRAYAIYLQTGEIPVRDSVGAAPDGMSVDSYDLESRKEQAQKAFDIVHDEGRPCIIHVCSSQYGSGEGHWLCVVGYKEGTTRENVKIDDLMVLDPAGGFDGDVSIKLRPVSEEAGYCAEDLDRCTYEPGYQIISYKEN
jgi:hypothetical protein